ncbi:acyltransferase [Candidatus Peregrinibacteria bacterium]|nr:acyltransferase [Candidatus Peregrinibacteria bacterium]
MAETTHAGVKSSKRIELLDIMRALAILNVVVYHFYSKWFNASFLIVPDGIAANLSRLEIFKGGSFFDLVKNIVSFVFVYGFMAVNVFLMLSGFVLMLSVLKKPEKADKEGFWEFVWKRCKRIVWPLYVSILVGIGIIVLRNVLFPNFAGDFLFGWLDIFKLIAVPFLFFDVETLQKFAGVYWFIPLILQLYLLFPFLNRWLRRVGPWKFLIPIFFITIAYRAYATYFLDTVPMGVVYPTQNSYSFFTFFLPRLFEFALGMALAWWYHKSPKLLDRLKGFWPVMLGIGFTFSGFFLNMYKPGWIFSDLAVTPGLFIVLFTLARGIEKSPLLQKFFLRVGDVSYELYLIHDYVLGYVVIPLIFTYPVHSEMWFWILLPLYVISSVAAARLSQGLATLLEKFPSSFLSSKR